MLKRTQVVMLPTVNNPTSISIANKSKIGEFHQFLFGKKEGIYNNHTFQHLYIISDDELKEGDWCIEFDLSFKPIEIFKCNGIIPGECIIRKIIASTNISLRIETELNAYYRNGIGGAKRLPQPSQQFIEKYIEEYNKGEVITDVLVEYEYIKKPVHDYPLNVIKQLKINPKDNTITIKEIKDNYSKIEVIELFKKHNIDICKKYHISYIQEFTNKWLDKNL